jgi:hypothetical protein
MRLRRRLLTAALVLGLALPGLAACADAKGSCDKGQCRLDLHEGSQLSLDGADFVVKRVDAASIVIGSHGFSYTLHKGFDLKLGRFHLKLADVNEGAAGVDVSS